MIAKGLGGSKAVPPGLRRAGMASGPRLEAADATLAKGPPP